MAKAPAAPKTRLNQQQRKAITKGFTKAIAAQQVDVAEVSSIVIYSLKAAYDLIYDTQEKKDAIQLLITSGLYKTHVATNLDKVCCESSQFKVCCESSQFKEDAGYFKFLEVQRAYGLQRQSDQHVPLDMYQEFAIDQVPDDMIQRFMSNPPKGGPALITHMQKRLVKACYVSPEVIETYSAVCGMIKSAKFAEDLMDLVPELAPLVIKAASIKPAQSVILAPTIEMRKVLATLAPIEVEL